MNESDYPIHDRGQPPSFQSADKAAKAFGPKVARSTP